METRSWTLIITDIKFNEIGFAVRIRNVPESIASDSIKSHANMTKINQWWWIIKCSTHLKKYRVFQILWYLANNWLHFSLLTPAKLMPQFHQHYLPQAQAHHMWVAGWLWKCKVRVYRYSWCWSVLFLWLSGQIQNKY